MNSLSGNDLNMKKTKNKGEWSELFTFVKIIAEQQILLANENLEPTGSYFKVSKLTGNNIDLNFFIIDQNRIEVINKNSESAKTIQIKELINSDLLNNLIAQIKAGKGTFTIPDFEVLQDALGLTTIKGGTSYQKADIVLDIYNETIAKENEGFSIKSYLGSKPTLP